MKYQKNQAMDDLIFLYTFAIKKCLGGDDRRVLLWNVEKAVCGVGKPVVMKTQHNSNIFCLSFDRCKSKIFSAGNDDQVIVHDMKT